MVREIVESGSWSSNVWAEVRSWRKSEGGVNVPVGRAGEGGRVWIAWRVMVG